MTDADRASGIGRALLKAHGTQHTSLASLIFQTLMFSVPTHIPYALTNYGRGCKVKVC